MSKYIKNQKKEMPHVFILLFFLILVATLMTHIIPSGEFERVQNTQTGQYIVVANSYMSTENIPVEIWEIPYKFFQALISKNTSRLIFFILFIGGSFEIIMRTDSIMTFFKKILIVFKDNRILIIPLFVTLFSTLGFTMGLSTASVIFIPIGILTSQLLGFDILTGTAMVALGVNAGFAAGIFNPFTIGIAQSIAEIPAYSGAWIRWLLLICLLIATILYITYYAKKFDKYSTIDKEKLNFDLKNMEISSNLSIRQKLVLLIFLSSFVVITFGISRWGWSIDQIAVLFFVTGIICGFTYGFRANQICDIFVDGCRKMMKGVFVIGLASTMRLILSEGQILDTIAYFLTKPLTNVPSWVTLMGMFYGNIILDFFITSGSAHGSVVMPIMTPMADYLNISRQSAVFAFQLGDGLANLCSPLSTTLTGILAVSNIPYGRWVKFFFPLVGIYLVIGTFFIIFATIVGY